MFRLTLLSRQSAASACVLVGMVLPRFGAAQTELDARGTYVHTFAGADLGRGLRLNNPFRLRTELGNSAQSLSLTATYGLLHAGAVLGEPEGLQNGFDARLSIALDGVRQEVFAPSYIALYPFPRRTLAYARLATPIVLEPDLNFGGEIAVGGVVFVTGGLGLAGEIVYSAFYGAGTWDRVASFIPLVSAEAGVWFDLEFLP